MKTTYKRNKDGSVDVSFKGLTQGKVMALCDALDDKARHSPVGFDIMVSLRNAVQNHRGPEDFADQDQQVFEALQ